VAILFTDLEGFSSWALEAGDDRSLELLRSLGVTVETRVDDYGGRIVKRLGDGIMAVFDDPAAAVEAVHEVMAAIRDVRVDGYQPRMRAGIHYGEPRRMGGDYLGVDVTVAARLCDMAHGGQVLISEEVCRHLDGDVEVVPRLVPLKKGTPDDLEVYAVVPADNPPALSG
jgi:adenylate cyclase